MRSAGRDAVVDRGRLLVRRDCSALQAAKMLAEAAVDVEWQAGRCGENIVLRGVGVGTKGDCDRASQDSAEGRSMAGGP